MKTLETFYKLYSPKTTKFLSVDKHGNPVKMLGIEEQVTHKNINQLCTYEPTYKIETIRRLDASWYT